MGEVVDDGPALDEIRPRAEWSARRQRREGGRREAPLGLGGFEESRAERVEEAGRAPRLADPLQYGIFPNYRLQLGTGESGDVLAHGGRRVDAGQDRGLPCRALGEARNAHGGVEAVGE